MATSAALDCAALDQLLSEAKTDFPALQKRRFEAAQCVPRGKQFRCDWTFPADRFESARGQAERLKRCIAAGAGAEALPSKRGEFAFQVNPETSALVRGPELDSGSWTLRLQFSTSADWN